MAVHTANIASFETREAARQVASLSREAKRRLDQFVASIDDGWT
jgi:hypothetical protein